MDQTLNHHIKPFREASDHLDYIRYQQDYKFISVFLTSKGSPLKKQFRCVNCGRIVFEYYSDIRLIFEGIPQEVERPIDCSCKRCKILYKII